MSTATEKPSVKDYQEPAPQTDMEAFARVVESRRSVRRFHDEPVPDHVVERCLDLARAAWRNDTRPDSRGFDIGVRVVRRPPSHPL